MDPYAKVIGRAVRWDDSLFGFRFGEDDTTFDDRDSAPYAPLAAVVDSAFTWGDDRPLRTPWHETLIYELHVKGFTQAATRTSPKRCAAPTSASRRSRRSATSTSLGVTAVELMPVHHHIDDWHLVAARPDATTGATTRSSYFAPDVALRRVGIAARRACASSR